MPSLEVDTVLLEDLVEGWLVNLVPKCIIRVGINSFEHTHVVEYHRKISPDVYIKPQY